MLKFLCRLKVHKTSGHFIYENLLPKNTSIHQLTDIQKKEVERNLYQHLSRPVSFNLCKFLEEVEDVKPKSLGIFLNEITEKFFFNIDEMRLAQYMKSMTLKNNQIGNKLFLKMLLKNYDNFNSMSMHIYISNVLDYQEIDEETKKSIFLKIRNVKLTYFNLPVIAKICKNLNSPELAQNILLFIESDENYENFSLNNHIITLYHLNKKKFITENEKKKLLSRINTLMELNKYSITKVFDLFLTDYKSYPAFNSMTEKEAKFILDDLQTREILNIFNCVGLKYSEFSLNLAETFYNKILTLNLGMNTMDIATVFHNIRKFSLNIKPFLDYINEKVIYLASPVEAAIIYHSSYKFLDKSKAALLREKILKSINQISPKLVLNIAKDLVDNESHYDKDFVKKFEEEASKLFVNHKSPEMIEFKTQLITFYYQKHKLDHFESSSEDDLE